MSKSYRKRSIYKFLFLLLGKVSIIDWASFHRALLTGNTYLWEYVCVCVHVHVHNSYVCCLNYDQGNHDHQIPVATTHSLSLIFLCVSFMSEKEECGWRTLISSCFCPQVWSRTSFKSKEGMWKVKVKGIPLWKLMASDKNKLLKDSTFWYSTSFDSDSVGSCWNKHREMRALTIATLSHLPQQILLEPITRHFTGFCHRLRPTQHWPLGFLTRIGAAKSTTSACLFHSPR